MVWRVAATGEAAESARVQSVTRHQTIGEREWGPMIILKRSALRLSEICRIEIEFASTANPETIGNRSPKQRKHKRIAL